jgi:hypothetical protein
LLKAKENPSAGGKRREAFSGDAAAYREGLGAPRSWWFLDQVQW